MSRYEVVDFPNIDTKLISLDDKKSNQFGGYSVRIRYNGKKLYVKYGERRCHMGTMKWISRTSTSYSVSISVDDDPYMKKANELDKFFTDKLGSEWRPIIKGEHSRMDFKVSAETRFFGDSLPEKLEDKVPRGANIAVLALWNNVSIGDDYGAVIKPRALQIRVCDIPETDNESDDEPSECLC